MIFSRNVDRDRLKFLTEVRPYKEGLDYLKPDQNETNLDSINASSHVIESLRVLASDFLPLPRLPRALHISLPARLQHRPLTRFTRTASTR